MSNFKGFERPQSNYCKVPNSFWEIDDLTVYGRMVLLYILRHTWGYQEYGIHKRITVDEFQNGRKRSDGSRMDKGVGMSRGAIHNALASLADKGYLSVDIDESDAARVKKSYMITMQVNGNEESNEPLDSVHHMNAAFTERTQRSLNEPVQRKKPKKDTKEKNLSAPQSDTGSDTDNLGDSNAIKSDSDKLTSDEYKQYVELLVQAPFKVYGKKNMNIYHMLRGSTSMKKRHTEYFKCSASFRDSPVSLAELRGFIAWYKRTKPDTELSVPETIESNVLRYRSEQAPNQHTQFVASNVERPSVEADYLPRNENAS